jgi:hypothetical protein
VKRCGKNSRDMEVKNGSIHASAHATTCYGASRGLGDVIPNDEWCVFGELTQVESSYSLKQLSLIQPVILLLMCGEDEVDVTDASKALELLGGWAKFDVSSAGGASPGDRKKQLVQIRILKPLMTEMIMIHYD